jgi:hypothetical protein
MEHGIEQAAAAERAAARRSTLALYALGLAGLITFALTVAERIAFPWPLEWMEGATVQHAQRLLQGRPLYPPPSAEFVPYLYPPLAYLPMALAIALLGPTLPAARVASLACTLGALLLIGRAGRQAAGHAAAGWAAAGLFAIGFGYGGAFVDLARVDACFVLLVVAAAERLLAGRTRAALLLLALSAFAKQHGVVLLLAVALAVLIRERRRAAADVALAFGLLALGYAGLELASAGWFRRYVVALPLHQGARPALFLTFFAVDLLVYLPVLVIAAVVAARARRPGAFEALLLAACVVGALGRAHPGGHDNVRLPAFALLCIAGGAALSQLALGSTRRGVRGMALAALALQLALLWQAPSFHAPSPASARRFAALQAALARCAAGGDAVALDYAGLTPRPFVHTMALSDVRLDEGSALAHDASAALIAELAAPSAPAAIAVGESFPELARVLAARYRPCTELPAPVLATGYVPGAPADQGRLLQRVYSLSSPP